MENERPKTVTSALPPYVGMIDGQYLQPAEKITELTDEIKADAFVMKKALKECYLKGFANGRRGLALAHPQVNMRPWAFFVAFDVEELEGMGEHDKVSIKAFYNPAILEFGGRKRGKDEMCLSFPFHPKSRVDRWGKVRVSWQDDNFEHQEAWIEGKFAQVWQHEMEHLLGGTIYGAPMW